MMERNTGRTTRMLEDVLSKAWGLANSSTPKAGLLVLTHTYNLAQDLTALFRQRCLDASMPIQGKSRLDVAFNRGQTLVHFRSVDYDRAGIRALRITQPPYVDNSVELDRLSMDKARIIATENGWQYVNGTRKKGDGDEDPFKDHAVNPRLWADFVESLK
jgi:hypothetical protein